MSITPFPSHRLRASPDTPAPGLRVGIDIGGTKTDAVLLAGARILHRIVVPTVPGDHGVASTVTHVVDELLAAQSLDPSDIDGYGIGIPGVVDPETGVVRNALNLGISTLPLGEVLELALGRPVALENDVNAMAVGLHREIATRPDASLALVNLGTGLAAGIVLGGRLVRGATGGAGEIGHIPLGGRDDLCHCGQAGCAELYASGAGDRRVVRDPAVRLDDIARTVAHTVRMLALTLDVDMLAIGGGFATHTPGLHGAIVDTLGRWQAQSPLLRSYDLVGRLVTIPADRPIAALGAASLARVAGR